MTIECPELCPIKPICLKIFRTNFADAALRYNKDKKTFDITPAARTCLDTHGIECAMFGAATVDTAIAKVRKKRPLYG